MKTAVRSKTHFRKDVYDLVPQWFKDSEEGQYTVMLGDDIDSLASAMVLNQVLGWKVNWFYNFHNVHVLDESNTTERVGVDFAIERGKTIDNHVTLVKKDDYVNPESVNLNTIYQVSRQNYTTKYAGSTLLLLWSLLGLELPESDEGKKILLTIDSAFRGHYEERFKEAHNEWFRKLGFEELIEFLDTKTTFNELNKRVRLQYGLTKKIYVSEKEGGALKHTGLDLEGISELLGIDVHLPEGQFTKVLELQRGNANLNEFQKKNGKELVKSRKVFSFALTYRDVCSYTML